MDVISDAVPFPVPEQRSSGGVSLQSHRALVSWMEDQEKPQVILGRSPLPTDDLAILQQKISAYEAAVLSRPVFTPTNPIIPVEDRSLLEAIRARPDIKTAFDGLGMKWEPVMVNLKEVLAFQKTVRTDNLGSRLAPALLSQDQLVELCFPSSLSTELFLQRGDDGYTIVTSTPNFSVFTGQPQIEGGKLSSLPFIPMVNTSFFQVAHYEGRYFIRDGYHRGVGFLYEGKDIVPCILVQAQSLEQIGWKPGMIRSEILFGEHPPRLVDFLDDAVSCSFLRQAMRRMYRLRLDMFEIPE